MNIDDGCAIACELAEALAVGLVEDAKEETQDAHDLKVCLDIATASKAVMQKVVDEFVAKCAGRKATEDDFSGLTKALSDVVRKAQVSMETYRRLPTRPQVNGGVLLIPAKRSASMTIPRRS